MMSVSQPTRQPAVRVIDIASELGRTAYDAYRASLPGNMMLSWDELTTPTRNAWYQAAQAAANRVRAEQEVLAERAANAIDCIVKTGK